MTILLPHVAARIFNVPLMIDAAKAAAIMAGIGGRVVDDGILIEDVEPIDHVAFQNGRPSMGIVGDPLGRAYEAEGLGARMLMTIDQVAIIPVEGTLVHKGKFLGRSSGETSYEGLQARVARARRDRSVKAVVFEVDSFGGEVAGAFDTADMIAQLSAEKPTLAILTDFAFSAGYLLASAARQIVMPQTGGAGSIGVITMHADFSQKLEKQGIKVTVLSSGARKADGHPALPLAAEVMADIQASLDRGRDLFAEKVANYRGSRLTKQAALATEARAFRGQDAVDAGLADGIMRPTDAFDEFVSAVHQGRRPN
jgi:signal peptide peptidase SppA